MAFVHVPGVAALERSTLLARSLHPTRLLLALLVIAASLLPASAAAQTAGGSYAGWVMDAYPSMSAADMQSTLQRMRDGGANLVWIGHNNPVDVDPNAKEVALSYAVYAAATNPADPNNAAAQSIIAAQRRALDAARAVDLKVVLPIGYRTQMGPAWNAQHPDSLRRGPDGSILNFGGEDASPYASQFRTDTTSYYRWIEQQFVAPYRDVLLMVMLSNEPSGVDYSPAADSAFAAQYGYHFADVGNDPRREQQLGSFQSHVMVDFTVWAANTWQAIDPAITVNMTYDGSPGRNNMQAPALEDLFRAPPSNFQPGWDTQIRNGSPTDSLNDADVTALATFVGTLAHFSAKYQRPYWLWSAGNSWGLGGGSGDPSNIGDAVVNLHALADISREAGGLLRGVAVWAYNVRGQGLYNDAYHPPYNADQLFARVTAALPAIRAIIDGPAGPGANVLVLAPNDMPDEMLGAGRVVDIWAFRGYNFADLVSLVRTGATTAVVGTVVGEDLSHVKMLVVLARGPDDLTPQDVAAIQAFRLGGGVVVDASTYDGADHLNAQWVYPGNAPELFFADSYPQDKASPAKAMGLPRFTNSFVFVGPRELVIYGGTSLDPAYKMQAWVRLPFAVTLTRYSAGAQAEASKVIGPGLATISTQRHAYALAPLTPVAQTQLHDDRYFSQTGFRIDNDAIWNYFTHRGGVRTFGYPTSRTITFEGFRTQFFQREVVQLPPSGSPRTLNLLDAGLLPYTSFNQSTFPAPNQALIATAPTPDQPDYAAQAVQWTLANAPDRWNGLPVNFGHTFLTTVTLSDAFPNGKGDSSLVPLLNLELWGLPTSAPAYDPNNHNFVYQRFQRGIMHYDAGCNCTQGILLADYLKEVLENENLPSDLAAEAADSPLLGQYDPIGLNWLSRPQLLPGTDLSQAFERG